MSLRRSSRPAGGGDRLGYVEDHAPFSPESCRFHRDSHRIERSGAISRSGATAAVAAAVAVVVGGIGGEATSQTRTRRSVDGPVTREAVVRSLSVVPAREEEEVGPAGIDGLAPAPDAPAELSVMLRINFALESANLTPEALRDLDQVAAALLDPRLTDVAVILEGHTDASGAAGYNLDLSRRRADAVLAHLVRRGVPRNRLRAVGYGESRLLSGHPPADGFQRRVEIVRTFQPTLFQ